MKNHLRILFAATALALFAMLAGPACTNAQLCPTVTYINTTGFTVTVNLNNAPSVTLGPFLSVVQPGPFTITGIVGASGTGYLWAVNPAPPPAAWLPSVQLKTVPRPDLCYDVFWDPATCTVTVKFAGLPPCLNP